MKNNFNIERVIDQLEGRGWTNFLSPKDLMLVKNKLGKKGYAIYYFYDEVVKVILYKKVKPKVRLLKIKVLNVRHSDVMGTIYSLGLNDDMWGDIVKYNDDFYVFLVDSIFDYVRYNLLEIKGERCALEEVDLEVANSFSIEYERVELNVSSLRIDNVIATLIGVSRAKVMEMYKEKGIVLNYSDTFKLSKVLRENDIFSVRRYGKFKLKAFLRETKKGNKIVEIYKYK